MIRRVLTASALAVAALGISAPLAQAAPGFPQPITVEHKQSKFSGAQSQECLPLIGCFAKLTGTLTTSGPAADCYQLQYRGPSGLNNWHSVTAVVCGGAETPVSRDFRPPSPQPLGYRICLFQGGLQRSCSSL